MARLKIEHVAQRRAKQGLSLRDRVVGHLPDYARWASRLSPLANAALAVPGVERLVSRVLGFAPERSLPRFQSNSWLDGERDGSATAAGEGRPVAVLFADTFNNWLEPGNLTAARRFIEAAGYRVVLSRGPDGRALCCGRTFLSTGLADRARDEMRRLVEGLHPWVEKGAAIVGLEPSCLHTLHDELLAMLPDNPKAQAVASAAMTFEAFAARAARSGTPIPWAMRGPARYLVHGHCHQKAFASFGDTLAALGAIPGAEVSAVESSCCGMAGSFGYEREHYDASMRMAEAALLPAVRAAGDAFVVAAGTSCRGQIAHGAARAAVHPAVALAEALAP